MRRRSSGRAAARRRVRSALRDEVRRLATDEADREEMRLVGEQVAEFARCTRDNGWFAVRSSTCLRPRAPRGPEQRGARYAIVVQAD